VNTVMNLRVPQNIENTTGGFSRRAQIHEVSHHSTITPYSSITTLLKYAIVLTRSTLSHPRFLSWGLHRWPGTCLVLERESWFLF
jgi:hypothetical protein